MYIYKFFFFIKVETQESNIQKEKCIYKVFQKVNVLLLYEFSFLCLTLNIINSL